MIVESLSIGCTHKHYNYDTHTLIKADPSSVPVVPKLQQLPHIPWSLTGVTAPTRGEREGGKEREDVKTHTPHTVTLTSESPVVVLWYFSAAECWFVENASRGVRGVSVASHACYLLVSTISQMVHLELVGEITTIHGVNVPTHINTL